MKKLIGSLVLAAGVTVATVHPAAAGSSTDAALALGAFAVFNQIVRGETIFQLPPRVVHETVVVQRPPVVVPVPPRVVYAPPPLVVPPPPAVVHRPARPVVVAPHGRRVPARGGWVWVPVRARDGRAWGHRHHR